MMPDVVHADVAVLGSGPGGAITACLLAEAGRDVLLVEDGPNLPLDSCPPFSIHEMRQKYRNRGVTAALGQPSITYVEGRCVGGGSEINSGFHHRTPSDVLERWRREFRVEALEDDDLESHFEACERDLSVSLLPGPAPAASLKLHDGAQQLGWRSLEVPRWYRYEADDERGAKQSMSVTFVPRALAAGARLQPDTRALRLRRHGDTWQITCRHRPVGAPPRSLQIRSRTVFVACGAIQTPALLRRSGIRRHVGTTLHMHPTVKVVARFDDRVNAPGMGIPVHQVKEFAPRYSFGCSISAVPHLALALTDHPEALAGLDDEWRHLAVYYAMIGGGRGTVRALPGFDDPLVRFALAPADLTDLADAMRDLCRALLASGATRLHPSIRGTSPLTSDGDLGMLPDAVPRDRTSAMTIHAFSTCPMGENPARCAADSFGRIHGVPGLHVADASLLCGPPGVNPQGSIMAIVRRNAAHFLDAAR